MLSSAKATVSKHGIAAARLTVYGVSSPVPGVSVKTGNGKAKNRRVALIEQQQQTDRAMKYKKEDRIMLKTVVVMGMVFVISIISTARAEEHFGIPVYPGAKPDVASGKFCSIVDPSGKYAVCFRTSDSFEKVAAFYKKQANLKPGMTLVSGGMSFAAFCPKEQDGCPGVLNGIDVTLNSPWSANMNLPINATPKDYENKDVRIRIYNKEAQMKQFNQNQPK